MERQIPKNVRQIGNVSDSPKIYVEDYVDTFFAQLCEKAGEGPIGAFLIGDIQKTNDEEYVYIYGAIQMHDLKMAGKDYVIDDDAWKKGYEECKQYFEDGEMLGWFVAHSGVPLEPEHNTVKLHKKSFSKKNSIFIMKDPVEKDEVYYALKLNDLMEIGGHYTYYEKNPCMQNYMISTRKKNGVCPSETVEDRAAKDFRSLVRTREEQLHQKRTNRMMYAVSACLVLVVIIMGVTTLNNFDKMKSVQSALNSLSNSSTSDTKSVEARETNGNVTAVTDEAVGQETPNDTQESKPESDGQASDNGADADAKNEDVDSASAGANGSDGVYIVEQGDTLAIISQKTYGDISHVDAICKMNGLTDGNLIYVGQKLILP
ncbi:MAG: LysM peptidoglycan-binding domain-containing protein [Muricomes sp.]